MKKNLPLLLIAFSLVAAITFMKRGADTDATKHEKININAKNLDTMLAEKQKRQPASVDKLEVSTLERLKSDNFLEEKLKKESLTKEVKILKEITGLNPDQFTNEIKAIEVFDKQLAAELREELNLSPDDLEELEPEYTEQLEVDFDSFEFEL